MPTEPRAGSTVKRERGNVTVEVGTDGLDTAGIEREFDQSFAFMDKLMETGTVAYRSKYRRLGPLKVMAYKEVGPPPWRWPRIGVQVSEDRRFVRLIVGWRSTAYALCLLWRNR